MTQSSIENEHNSIHKYKRDFKSRPISQTLFFFKKEEIRGQGSSTAKKQGARPPTLFKCLQKRMEREEEAEETKPSLLCSDNRLPRRKTAMKRGQIAAHRQDQRVLRPMLIPVSLQRLRRLSSFFGTARRSGGAEQ